MEPVSITELPLLWSSERGANWGLKTRKRDDFMLIMRKAGTVNANHAHKGALSEKNPETILFIDGKALLEWRDKGGGIQKRELGKPCKIEIPPNVWHRLTAVTDIIFMEEGWLSPEEYERDTIKG